MKFTMYILLFCFSINISAQFKHKPVSRLSELFVQSPESIQTVVKDPGYFSDRWEEIKDDINYGLKTGEKLGNNFGTAETWKGIGISVAVVGAASLLDKEVRNFTQRNQSNFGDKLAQIDDYFGSGKTGYYIGGIYLIGLVSESPGLRKAGAELITASAYTGFFTGLIKYAAGRARPKTGEDPYSFYPGSTSFEHTSFLSGHTSWTFAFSTVMAEQYESVYWKSAWYLAAATVGYARMYHNVHWFSDVVAGALLGYSIGKLSVSVMKDKVKTVVVAPVPQPYTVSFVIPLR